MAEYIHSINRNTVMMIISSYPYSVNSEKEKLPAIIYSSHAGAHLGTAAAKVIRGEYNPAGRLSQTWYRSEHDLPEITDYDIESAKTTYMYFEGTPLFPFGYGLSYSEFEYSGFSVSENDGILSAELDVKNTSQTDGEEVVQIYFTMTDSQVSRPVKKLCAFDRVRIGAGETVHVSVEIPRDILRIYNVRTQEMMIEKGRYRFFAAASSDDIRAEYEIQLSGEELGIRPDNFDAQCFDSANGFKIFYSPRLDRHYIRVCGWGGTAVYEGAVLSSKSKLLISASSVLGKGNITVDFGKEQASLDIAPSLAYDDFSVYYVDIPDSAADKLVISAGENVSILDLKAE